MEMVISDKKQELRKKLLSRLLSLTRNEIKRRSNNVEENLSNLSIYKYAKKVMAYYPLKGEVDILKMIRKDLKEKQFCFPVMDLKTKSIRAFRVSNLDEDFIPGPYGVMEPDVGKTEEADIKEIDMVIVPGLGFDDQKNRLGRGAGFYDRFLQNLAPSIKKVGIAFECQLLHDLPIHLPTDQKVDIVVSEKVII
jgi:5-formyltetrahydrofolate cyclo-ligase